MRTTLQIDDDVLDAAKSLARAENKSIGEVLSGLARRALAPDSKTKHRRGFPVFMVSRTAAPITPEQVKRALDDE